MLLLDDARRCSGRDQRLGKVVTGSARDGGIYFNPCTTGRNGSSC